MADLLEAWMPTWDVRERHFVRVRAPVTLVYDVARRIDAQSIPIVHWIFALRERVMGAASAPRVPRAFLDEVRELGWGCLRESPGELFAFGAFCQPWQANVRFAAIPPDEFEAFAQPGQVKIAWTMETCALDATSAELATETRAVATDDAARAKFLAYWRWARAGIVPIRWLLLAAIRREAERAWRERRHAGTAVTG